MSHKVDFHTHTYYSDGTLSPVELIQWAKKNDLEQIALTDHDGMDGIREAKIAAEALGLSFIPGIELSTKEPDGLEMHILGYYMDIENQKLKARLEEIRNNRKDRNAKLKQALADMGYPLEEKDFQKPQGTEYLGKPDFARALQSRGYIKEFSQAFEEGHFLKAKELQHVRKQKITAEEAIHLILQAGGIPVLAHPMKVKGIRADDFQALEALLVRLKGYGLKGLECFYPQHSEEEAMKLVGLAEKFKLHITEGSDYHGPEPSLETKG